jgi:hypothetical protein
MVVKFWAVPWNIVGGSVVRAETACCNAEPLNTTKKKAISTPTFLNRRNDSDMAKTHLYVFGRVMPVS